MNENGQKLVQKQKILFVITQGSWGGAQRYVYDLATNINKNFDVTIAVGEPDGSRDLQNKILKYCNTEYCNIKIFSLNHLVRRISPWHDILAILELARLYKKLKPGITHLNSSKAGIIGSLAKLLYQSSRGNNNINIVYTAHGWVFDEPLPYFKRKIYAWLEKFTARFKDKIIVLSKKDFKTAVTELKIPKEKLRIITHGIGAEQNNYTRESARVKLRELSGTNIPPNNIWVGTIANFYPTKGLDIMLEAISAIKDNLKNASFIIIGDGPERNNLLQIIKNNHLEKIVYLTGFIEDAGQLIRAFDFTVFPSRKEGYPYAILETVLTKIPVIATSVGGIHEIITNKKTGLLVEKAEARYLSEAILFALNNQKTMQNWAEAGASQMSSLMKLDDMVQRIISCYSL